MYTARLVRAADCSGYCSAVYLCNYGINNFFNIVGTNNVIAIRDVRGLKPHLGLISNIKIEEKPRVTMMKQRLYDKMGKTIPKKRITTYKVNRVMPREDMRVILYDLVG